MFSKINPTTTKAWQLLRDHFEKVKDVKLTDLFAHDKSRFTSFSLTHSDILFDYSKNNVNEETTELLIRLAEECMLSDAVSAMFTGEKINETEGRAALHTALRDIDNPELIIDGKNIMIDIHRVLLQMKSICDKVHNGEWTGFSGKKIRNIVNIGIGGSHLGPSMVTDALRPFWQPAIQPYFISNIDAADLSETLKCIEADETLFIIASKTFTTQETMTNAVSAREWFLQNGGSDDAIEKHFIAISTNTEAVVQFGIAKENMFEFWDWVGGRYSVWSAIGLPVALTVGFSHFESFLNGAHDIDIHFRDTRFEKNIPVMMALTGIWSRNFFGASSVAVLPYNQLLHKFPAYLQQADMESNGKSVDRNGDPVSYNTGPIIWGEPGTNGQHAFYQLIHQGTERITCDFIACAQSHYELEDHHLKLMSNFFAQTEALMNGADSKDCHRKFSGNRPTNSILLTRLSPFSLGQLIAMYEHKIFVQGVIWNIYSFDQFGVELGKVLANNVLPELEGDQPVNSHDSSTNGLINTFKNMRL